MHDICIKKMTAEDASAYTADMAVFDDAAWAIGVFGEFIDDPDAYFFKAYLDGEIAGYCGAYHNTMNARHFLKIMDLRVKPEFRRLGVAKTLMLEVLKLAKKLGLDRIKLEVETKNDARKLYEALGFQIEGIEEGFYDNGADAYIMWRYDSIQQDNK